MARAVELVADIPELRQALTERGSRRVEAFSLERTGARLLAALEEELRAVRPWAELTKGNSGFGVDFG